MIYPHYVKWRYTVHNKVKTTNDSYLLRNKLNPQTAALNKCCICLGSKTCRMLSEKNCCSTEWQEEKKSGVTWPLLEKLSWPQWPQSSCSLFYCCYLWGWAIVFLQLCRYAVTVWSQFSVWGGGGAEKQADRQVRTQETEAECNRGRTTCHPAWGGLNGSSRSEGPGSLPVDLACGFWWVESRKWWIRKLFKMHANSILIFSQSNEQFATPQAPRLRKTLTNNQSCGLSLPLCHSHQHDPQLEEVVVLWILHLHHSPGVQPAPHLLPLGLNLLVGSHHCKRDAGLKKRTTLAQSVNDQNETCITRRNALY